MLIVAPQANLFSNALTAFVVDSKQDLLASPADETVYYLQKRGLVVEVGEGSLTTFVGDDIMIMIGDMEGGDCAQDRTRSGIT